MESSQFPMTYIIISDIIKKVRVFNGIINKKGKIHAQFYTHMSYNSVYNLGITIFYQTFSACKKIYI